MTTQEFSIEFDILYNNLASNAAPPLNEYEKSVFLTKAQSDIVLELYSGRNNLGLAFESSEEVRRYLSTLETREEGTVEYEEEKGFVVTSPSTIWFVTREEFQNIVVTPITQDEYKMIKDNPFRGPKKGKRVLRVGNVILQDEGLIIPLSIDDNSVTYPYFYYGLKCPRPIILEVGEASLTINGETCDEPTECELHSSLHGKILDRAVLLAKQAYIGGQVQQAQ